LGTFGLVTIDQVVPFHRSTNVVVDWYAFEPTAKQLVALVHDTPRSVGSPCSGFGLPTIDQVVPFHRSINVRGWPLSLRKPPTAKQLVALVQDTPDSKLYIAFAGFGLATTDQLVPFHRTMSVPASALPTAKQLVVLTHDTLASELAPAPDGVGTATIVHVLPSQRSASEWSPGS
jgi:hypothetical protein